MTTPTYRVMLSKAKHLRLFAQSDDAYLSRHVEQSETSEALRFAQSDVRFAQSETVSRHVEHSETSEALRFAQSDVRFAQSDVRFAQNDDAYLSRHVEQSETSEALRSE
ncbi:MAG: hypothetical protein NT027_08600 [Proteobacteria bacterium]|nr:hypothetical protein [Pseudomonadota bacterium]